MTKLPSSELAIGPLLDQLSDGIALAAAETRRLVFVNRTLAGWLGGNAAQLQGASLAELFAEGGSDLSLLVESILEGTENTAATPARLRSSAVSSEEFDIRLCKYLCDQQELIGIVVRRAPVADGTTMSGRARRDPLTGLPDREFLSQRLSALLKSKRITDRQFAVLFIDLDNFKQVNDAHGHLLGDLVLSEAARRLVASVRDDDHVVRFGGDEFVVLLEQVREPGTIDAIIERIHAALARPVALPQGEFTLSLSIGLAQASPDCHSAEDLLREADRNMYAAKRVRNGKKTHPAAV